ncbi:MAG: class I SAM-dependent methyltransferase [Nanoarchaeota archaeon]
MKNKFTRGEGLLEEFLSRKRAKMADFFIRESDRKGKILDIGCGKYPYFLSYVRFKRKYGIDYQEPIKSREFKLKKADLANLRRLPYNSNNFDVVAMLAVIEHLNPEIIQGILKDIRRILKSEGRLIITTPSPIGNFVLKIMAIFKLVSHEEINEHKKIYSLKELERAAAASGLKVVKKGNFEFFMNNYLCAEKNN